MEENETNVSIEYKTKLEYTSAMNRFINLPQDLTHFLHSKLMEGITEELEPGITYTIIIDIKSNGN